MFVLEESVEVDFIKRIEIAYRWGTENAYRFERVRYYRKDLVQDAILYCLENSEKFLTVKHIPSWMYKVMKGIKTNTLKKASNRYETNVNFDNDSKDNKNDYENYAGSQIFDVEDYLDTVTILDFIKSDLFKGKQNNKKSVENTVNIFSKYIEGYSTEEISRNFNIKRTSVNTSTNNTRNKIRKRFGNLY